MAFIIDADINNDIGSGSLVGGSSYQVVKDLETITKAPTGRVVPKHIAKQQPPLLASLNMNFMLQQSPTSTGPDSLTQARLDSIAYADSVAQVRVDSTRNARKNRMNDARSNYNESLIYLGFTSRELTNLGLSANRVGNADTLVIFSKDLKPSRGEPYFILDRGGTVLYDSTLSSNSLVDLASRINPSAGARIAKTDVSIGQGMEDSVRTVIRDYLARDVNFYRGIEEAMQDLMESREDPETFVDDDFGRVMTSLQSIIVYLGRADTSGFRGDGFSERLGQHLEELEKIREDYEKNLKAAEKGSKDYINQIDGTSSVLSTETLEQIRQDSSEFEVKITQMDTLIKTIKEIESSSRSVRRAKGFPSHEDFMYSGNDDKKGIVESFERIYDELERDLQDEPLLLESIAEDYLRPQAEFVLEEFESALKQYSYTEKVDRTVEGINLGEKDSPNLIAEEREDLEEAIGMLEDFLGTVSKGYKQEKPKRSWFRRDAPSIRTSYESRDLREPEPKIPRSDRTHFGLDWAVSMHDDALGRYGNIGLNIVTPRGTLFELGAVGVDGMFEEPFVSPVEEIYNKSTGDLLANFHREGTNFTKTWGIGAYAGLNKDVLRRNTFSISVGGRYLFFPEEEIGPLSFTTKKYSEVNEWVVYHPSGIQEEMPTQEVPPEIVNQQKSLIQLKAGFRTALTKWLDVGVVGGVYYDLDTKEFGQGYLSLNVGMLR